MSKKPNWHARTWIRPFVMLTLLLVGLLLIVLSGGGQWPAWIGYGLVVGAFAVRGVQSMAGRLGRDPDRVERMLIWLGAGIFGAGLVSRVGWLGLSGLAWMSLIWIDLVVAAILASPGSTDGTPIGDR